MFKVRRSFHGHHESCQRSLSELRGSVAQSQHNEESNIWRTSWSILDQTLQNWLHALVETYKMYCCRLSAPTVAYHQLQR